MELSLKRTRCSWQLKTGVGDNTNLSVLDLRSVTHFLSLVPSHVLRLESSGMDCPEPNISTWLREDIAQITMRRIKL